MTDTSTPSAKTLHEKLIAIQSELKAPKGQKNTFGNYNYRSCEDILEALKPLLKDQGLVLTLSDAIENVGGRFYVRATACVFAEHGLDTPMYPNVLSVTAYAREAEERKGMDPSQITGAASSYARKYALNGLFCIDDTEDADSTNDHKEKPKAEPKQARKEVTAVAVMEALTACKAETPLMQIYKRAFEAKKDWAAQDVEKMNHCLLSCLVRLNQWTPKDNVFYDAQDKKVAVVVKKPVTGQLEVIREATLPDPTPQEMAVAMKAKMKPTEKEVQEAEDTAKHLT